MYVTGTKLSGTKANILVFFMVYVGVFGRLETVKEIQHIQNYLSSEIYSHDKVLLGKYYLQDRTNVRYDDLPQHLIDALIATNAVIKKQGLQGIIIPTKADMA